MSLFFKSVSCHAFFLLKWHVTVLDMCSVRLTSYILFLSFRFTEFQIWSLWECFQVLRMRSMSLAFIHLLEEALFMEQRCAFVSSGKILVIFSIGIIKLLFCCWMQEGKLRVLQCDGGRRVNCTKSIYFPEENMALVGQWARLWHILPFFLYF